MIEKTFDFEELDDKSKKIALRTLKKKIQRKVGIKIGIERAFLLRAATKHRFLKNGKYWELK